VGCFAVQKFALRCASLAELALTGLLKRKKSFPSLSLSLSLPECEARRLAACPLHTTERALPAGVATS